MPERLLLLHTLFEVLGYTAAGIVYTWLRGRRGGAAGMLLDTHGLAAPAIALGSAAPALLFLALGWFLEKRYATAGLGMVIGAGIALLLNGVCGIAIATSM